MNLPMFLGWMLIMAAVSAALAVGITPTTMYITAGITAVFGAGLVIGGAYRGR